MSYSQIFDLTNEFNILRLICGLFLLPHLYAKASDLELTYKIYDDFRLYPIKAWVFSCMAIEVVCTIGMVFAIYTRYVALIEADRNPLDGIAAFRAFTAGIRERCDEPPATVDLAEIGAFGL